MVERNAAKERSESTILPASSDQTSTSGSFGSTVSCTFARFRFPSRRRASLLAGDAVAAALLPLERARSASLNSPVRSGILCEQRSL